ncbi:MAG: 30S ribosome-binding factor RbfA [Oscillospiraceae bacterium]|jgi:ribosome-binding factor A|nr:30S ribosome-binding factor RbfA [Oscillospiraceae bacterium]
MARIDKVNEEIKHALSALLRSLKDPRVHGLVSITRIDATPDFKQAKVYISVLNGEDTGQVIKGLKSASGFLRRELGREVNLRNTPELIFLEDPSIKHGSHILDLLRSIDKPPQSDNTDDTDGGDKEQ